MSRRVSLAAVSFVVLVAAMAVLFTTLRVPSAPSRLSPVGATFRPASGYQVMLTGYDFAKPSKVGSAGRVNIFLITYWSFENRGPRRIKVRVRPSDFEVKAASAVTKPVFVKGITPHLLQRRGFVMPPHTFVRRHIIFPILEARNAIVLYRFHHVWYRWQLPA